MKNSKRDLVIVAALWLIATAVGLAIVGSIRFVPEPMSQEGDAIDHAFRLLVFVSVPVLMLVVVPLLYSALRFRRRDGHEEDGPAIRGHRGLEIGWVVGSTALVLSLAAFGWIELAEHGQAQAAADEAVVQVEGGQWYWRFRYPEHNVVSTELYLPVGQPARLELRSLDVLHAFWVPEFLWKQDVVPGRTTIMRVTPHQVGSYEAVCAELCGIAHGQMRTRVVVVEPREFEAWVAQQQASQADSPVAAGRVLFQSQGCIGCHSLSDAGSQSTVGPSLDALAARAGERKPGFSAEEYVSQHIADGSQGQTCCVAGFPPVMPPFKSRLSEEQIQQLTGYLLDVTRP